MHGSEEVRGQLALPFDLAMAPPAGRGELHELPRSPDAPVPLAVAPATAEQWLARARQLEERDPVDAAGTLPTNEISS